MNSIICPGLINITHKLIDYSKPPLRIIVKSGVRPPDKCITNVYLLNPVLNSLAVPFVLDYNGQMDLGGVLDDVRTNKSDVAIFPFLVTLQRFEEFKFSTPLGYSSPIAILSGRIPKKAYDFRVFKTFSYETSIVLAVITFTIALMSSTLTNAWKRNEKSPRCRFIDILFIYISSQLSQSSRYFKRHGSLIKFFLNYNMLVAISLFVLFFKSHVLSNIIYKPKYIINSMSDLAQVIDETNIKVIATGPKSILTWRFMENSNEKSFQKIYNHMIDERIYPIYEIARGKIILITYTHTLDALVKLNSHLNLHVSEQRHFGASFGLVYNKNIDESIKKSIDSVINVLYENGFQDFWHIKRLKVSTEMIKDKSNQIDIIHLENVVGVFKVLSFLEIFSIVTLFVEIFVVLRFNIKDIIVRLCKICKFK